ncbi:hypothetical protein [Agromyces cerinus]|uniref:hypothetical protein n=1 Tax=Agromyces cerinus TaxID=33878 RepID=UPI001177D032|nr:hypothetical protein [Agromyces cerinus]
MLSTRVGIPLRVSVVLAAAALALTGCGVTSGGQNADTATAQVLSVDGVESGGVYADSVWAGLVQKHSAGVSVTLDPDVEPTPEFFDSLVALAWSVDDHEPGELTVFIRTDPSVDARVLAEGAGWSPPRYGFDEVGGIIFVDEVEERFGPWPGEPPAAPTDALILPDADG